MPAPRNVEDMVRAARMYYLDNLSQTAVAKELHLSTSTVSRILAAAREQGIVEIRIHDPGLLAHVPELEERISSAFHVSSATVVPRPRGRAPVDVVAAAAARCFEQRAAQLTTFGLSWGVTIDKFVEECHVEPIKTGLTICPLVGGLPAEAGPAGNTSLDVLAMKSGARALRFDAPSVVESPLTWAALNSESTITQAVQRAASVEMAFVGIGSYGFHNSNRVVNAMQLSDAEFAQLSAQRPTGDICGRFFDINGEPLGLPTSERIIGISMDQLRAIPDAVGLAAGVEKAPGVVGALRTGALDSIILDEDLARAVLNLAGVE
ncbi:MAG: sugar-binding domain-containing protein [Propionibacteriaceae bacterium]|nr:sugar-binding domain-containing protein [Propionibacteriaceae bacterium]